MPLISELQAATDDYIDNHQPVDIYFTSNVLLFQLLSLGKTYPGGKKIQVNLEYDMSNTGPYGPRSEMPIDKKEVVNAAFFEYAAYFATLTIDMDDDLINAGPAQIVNLLRVKLNNAEKSLRKGMAQHIYLSRAAVIAASPDPDVRPFNGLADLFNTDPAVAYGEITQNDMAQWRSNVIANPRVMSYSFMQELRRTASIDNGNVGKPNLYITTSVLLDAFERTLQLQSRYSDQKLLDVGFTNLLFKGAPVVDDDICAADNIYGLNTKFLDVKTHTKRNFTRPLWTSPPRQPDTATANIRWAGNLVSSNRKAHVRASNVSVAE